MTAPTIPADECPAPCCVACGGSGANWSDPCSDCYATGHAHPTNPNRPAQPTQGPTVATNGAGVGAGEVGRLTEENGPECETCGKSTCPDAQLVAFSAPVDCEFVPIYEALRDAKDCDYGCARDLTNQGIRLYVVPAVESILRAHAERAWDEGVRRCDEAWHDRSAISVFDLNPYRDARQEQDR